MRTRTLAWSMAGAALLLGVAWLLWWRPAEPASSSAMPSNGATGSRTTHDLGPEFHEPTAPEEVSDTRAFELFVEHLEAVLEPKNGDDPDRVVLRVPEHLQEASKAEQQAYMEELLHHGEAMVRLTREQFASWEAEAEHNPELAADLARRRKDTDNAARSLDDLRARLLREGVLRDAGS